jgi:hypothetical protein
VSDAIKLEPAKAGQTLLHMQNLLKKFKDYLYTINMELRSISVVTYSEPILDAINLASHEINNLGQAVNAAVYYFSQAFVHVVEEWKKTDARHAASVSFERSDFEIIKLLPHSSTKIYVDIDDFSRIIHTIGESRRHVKTTFQEMDDLIKASHHYWQGHSGDQTRDKWKRLLEPLVTATLASIADVETSINDEIFAFMKRDASNWPGQL